VTHQLIAGASGERLTKESFNKAFVENFWKTDDLGFWKLKRQQTFQEPYDDSWNAFAQGNWKKSLQIIENQRSDIEEYYRKARRSGFSTYRVRVVEETITPYLQWELHLLRLRNQSGANIRVVFPHHIKIFEVNDVLPELVILGSKLMYEVIYDKQGVPAGGICFKDKALIAHCQRFIADLYQVGEELESFFEREVSSLEPPAVSGKI
jgi:hypothetical protein